MVTGTRVTRKRVKRNITGRSHETLDSFMDAARTPKSVAVATPYRAWQPSYCMVNKY